MSSKDKARRATTAADSALAAAKQAATLSKSLPDKQARKLAPLIKDAKKAGAVTKKQLEDKPRRIERTATDAILALADATAKIERRLAKKTDVKKSDSKRTDLKKSDAKKSDAKKTDAKNSTVKKSDAKKPAKNKSDVKNSSLNKSDSKSPQTDKSDTKKKARKRKSSPVPAVQVIEPTATPTTANPEPVTDPDPLPQVTASDTTPVVTILHSMTVASLRARAKAEGRVGYSRLSKAELIALFV